jgi:hypothetical protein
MAAKKKDRIKLTTPPGLLIFPKLNAVNYGTEKYPKKDGNFETGISVDKSHPEFEAFNAKIETYMGMAKEKAEEMFAELPVANRKELGGIKRKEFIKAMYDEQTEELLSTIKMGFQMKAGGIRKKGPQAGQVWFRRPMIFDAKGNPIPMFNMTTGKPISNAPRIWGGSKARVSFEIDTDEKGRVGYFVSAEGTYGLSVSLNAVKVLALAGAPAANAAQYGFGDDEEGFEYDAQQYAADAMEADESGDEANATSTTTTADAKISGNF